ncbi:hypothetical protein HZS55_09100 [Halosimplex rubrum]|uniref:Phage tail protein n=1 Tax=Halosimplex rubrum TaxID=869889 RepID=A0A7D5P2H0_9EURY|nr:hypothetical protein [Halosimplex rubrum]QLH77441.1 hypothetical protein HZS55_09100 [Halosimplex rubrum]
MTKQIYQGELELRIYAAGNTTSSPDATVPFDHVRSAQFARNAGPSRDSGVVEIYDQEAAYRDDLDIGLNSRVELWARLVGESSMSRRFTGLVKRAEPTVETNLRRVLRLELEDWVCGILGDRTIADAFDDMPVAGSPTAIIDTIVGNEAPEIDISALSNTTNDERSAQFNHTNLLEAVKEAADLVGAVIGSDGLKLLVKYRSEFTSTMTLGVDDVVLPVSLPVSKDDYANRVIIRGGRGARASVGQTAQDGYVLATDAAFLSQELSPKYPSVPRVDLWTRTTGTNESLTVRIQPGDGGQPVAPDDRTADIGRATVPATDLADGDWTTFRVGADDVPDPCWMIVESSQSNGQEVGYQDTSGDGTYQPDESLTYQLFESYPISAEATNQYEIGRRNRVDRKVPANDIDTVTAAKDLATTLLQTARVATREGDFEADSPRAHNLTPLDAINIGLPYLDADGTHVVTRVKHEFEANQLTTEFDTTNLGSIAANITGTPT